MTNSCNASQSVKVLLQQERYRWLCTASKATSAEGDSLTWCGRACLPCLAALLLTGSQGYCIAHCKTLAADGR